MVTPVWPALRRLSHRSSFSNFLPPAHEFPRQIQTPAGHTQYVSSPSLFFSKSSQAAPCWLRNHDNPYFLFIVKKHFSNTHIVHITLFPIKYYTSIISTGNRFSELATELQDFTTLHISVQLKFLLLFRGELKISAQTNSNVMHDTYMNESGRELKRNKVWTRARFKNGSLLRYLSRYSN